MSTCDIFFLEHRSSCWGGRGGPVLPTKKKKLAHVTSVLMLRRGYWRSDAESQLPPREHIFCSRFLFPRARLVFEHGLSHRRSVSVRPVINHLVCPCPCHGPDRYMVIRCIAWFGFVRWNSDSNVAVVVPVVVRKHEYGS